MLVLASQQQEQECGDGTNFVLVFAGALLENAEQLLRMVSFFNYLNFQLLVDCAISSLHYVYSLYIHTYNIREYVGQH